MVINSVLDCPTGSQVHKIHERHLFKYFSSASFSKFSFRSSSNFSLTLRWTLKLGKGCSRGSYAEATVAISLSPSPRLRQYSKFISTHRPPPYLQTTLTRHLDRLQRKTNDKLRPSTRTRIFQAREIQSFDAGCSCCHAHVSPL